MSDNVSSAPGSSEVPNQPPAPTSPPRWRRYFPKDAPDLLREAFVAVSCEAPDNIRLGKKAVLLGSFHYSAGPPWSYGGDLYFRLRKSFREWELVIVDESAGYDLGEPDRTLRWVLSSLPARLPRHQALALFTAKLLAEPRVSIDYEAKYAHYIPIAEDFLRHMKAQGWNTETWERGDESDEEE
ncbi:MAG: hypothetical protein WHT82_09085 [Limisphaera sp.]